MLQRNPERGEALGEIALIKIVGSTAKTDQILHKPPQNDGTVVDIAKEYALIASRHPVVRKELKSGTCRGGFQLERMIEVGIDPDRPVASKHRGKGRGDPLRNNDREPGTDPYDLDVRDRTDLPEHPVKPGIRENQGIATREKDISDRGGATDVVEALFDRCRADSLAVTDDASSCAVSTIERALVRGDQQDTVGVPVHQRRNRCRSILQKRVRRFDVSDAKFTTKRDRLSTDRTVRIIRVDQRRVMGADPETEEIGCSLQPLPLIACQRNDVLDLIDRYQTVAKLPAIIAPVRLGHITPERNRAIVTGKIEHEGTYERLKSCRTEAPGVTFPHRSGP